jgi:hypothetical protein
MVMLWLWIPDRNRLGLMSRVGLKTVSIYMVQIVTLQSTQIEYLLAYSTSKRMETSGFKHIFLGFPSGTQRSATVGEPMIRN